MDDVEKAIEEFQKVFSKVDIDKQIEAFQGMLDLWERAGVKNVSKPLHPFRNAVLFLHSRLDTTLEMMIGHKITSQCADKLTEQDRNKIEQKISIITSPMSFARKLELAVKMEILQSDSDLYKKMKRLNKIRNAFAHPDSKELYPIIHELEKKENLLKEMQQLALLMGTMVKLVPAQA